MKELWQDLSVPLCASLALFLIFACWHLIHIDAEYQALKTVCTGNAAK